VGFSLPNIVCALSHNRIDTATLLYTSEIPEVHIHRAIEIANECRKTPLSPAPDLLRIPSPDADSSMQFDAIRTIPENLDDPAHDIVVGVTGGTQRVLGSLLARFGTNRLMWVDRGPKATLRVGNRRWPEELVLEVGDYQRLYDIDEQEISSSEASIVGGRLSYSRTMVIQNYPKDLTGPYKKRVQFYRRWSKRAREDISKISAEINSLEKKFGRIQFHYNLDVIIEEDETKEKIIPILGRLPKSVQISINGRRSIDPIESIAVDSSITQSYVRSGIYDLLDADISAQDSETLHLLVGRYNSVSVANAILNHRPNRVCLWALNHEGKEEEVQSLCNQVFTIRGWIKGSLGADMGVREFKPPVCKHPPAEVLLINTNVNDIQGRLEELNIRRILEGSVIDVSSGSGHMTSSLIQGISQFSPNPTISYTHPWTGEITNLSTGDVTPGETLPIVERLWLSQRPVIRCNDNVDLDEGGRRLLIDIGEKSRDIADYSLSPSSWGGLTTNKLPLEPWGQIQTRHADCRRLRKPQRIEYSSGNNSFEFQMPTRGGELTGFWLDDMVRYAIPLRFPVLDCITSVEILTKNDENTLSDIEIDAIYIEEDGMRVASCKMGRKAWSIESYWEVLTWERLVGGPNCKSFIIHSNMFPPDSEGDNFAWGKEDPPTIDYLHWFDLLGIDFQIPGPVEEE